MVQGVVIDENNNCIVNVNPATGEVISLVPCTTPTEINAKVKLAQEAFAGWAFDTALDHRIELLKQGIDRLESQREEIALGIVTEMGKPRVDAEFELSHAFSKRGEFINLVHSSLKPQPLSTSDGGKTMLVRQAHGVVVILSPWNFPVEQILALSLPALASGNTVLVKPSEVTPDTGSRVVAALQEVLPPNVIQLVQGDGRVGAALVDHPGVALVAMVGSTATGHKILQSTLVEKQQQHQTNGNKDVAAAAADGAINNNCTTAVTNNPPAPTTTRPPLKRIVLELGGKDPMVVFADADLHKAATDAVVFSLLNAGQLCCSVERVYVAESVYDEFQALVVAICASEYNIVGNGLDPDVKIGPLVSHMQCQHVATQVEDAIRCGAKLLYQSKVPTAGGSGSFYPVTVLGHVTQDMALMRDETFGPVVALATFDGSQEEAVRLANDTEYGLTASVYSADDDLAQRVASRMVAGLVGINCNYVSRFHPHAPWVGHKNSGFGFHGGVEGCLQFSLPKTIACNP